MNPNQSKFLTRDVEASVVPVGTKVTLQKGGQAYVTQSLGGTFTVVVNGNMFRIDGKDADALGLEIKSAPATLRTEFAKGKTKADVKKCSGRSMKWSPPAKSRATSASWRCSPGYMNFPPGEMRDLVLASRHGGAQGRRQTGDDGVGSCLKTNGTLDNLPTNGIFEA